MGGPDDARDFGIGHETIPNKTGAVTDLHLKVGGDLYDASKNNWGPQIGFAWRPNPGSQRWVLCGGAGIGYNRMQEAVTLNGRSNPPLIAGLTLSSPNIVYILPIDSCSCRRGLVFEFA